MKLKNKIVFKTESKTTSRLFLILGLMFIFFISAAPVLAQNSGVGGPCQTNGDCQQGQGLICDPGTNTCSYGSGGITGGSSGQKQCVLASDCPSGQTCYNGACITNPTNGSGNNACAGVTCIPGCTCANQNGGICVLSSNPSQPCTTSSGGPSGSTGPNGGCTLDTDCGSNQYCNLSAGVNNGVCATKTYSGQTGGLTGSGGGTTGVSTGCPDGLQSVNGLCLPQGTSFPTTGLAGSTTLSGLLVKIIQILLTFAGIIAVVMVILGGYWYMAAGGNEEMSEKGRKTITNFVLGLVVIILAYTIVTILYDTLTSDHLIQ